MLLTIGMKDRYLKIWHSISDNIVHDIPVPDAVISMGVAGGFPTKIVLVGEEGKAVQFTLTEEKVGLINNLDGEDYHAVATPNSEILENYYLEQMEIKVHRIVTNIQENISKMPEASNENLHSELIKLGYEHVSLAQPL